MSGHLRNFIIVVVLGSVLIVAARFGLPLFEDRLQRSSSDASAIRSVVRVGVDNWIGYFPLCAGHMAARMREAGYDLRCEDDRADYPARLESLGQGKLQFAVATVDSYLLNGAELDYPGVIVAVIDQSKGGDAIVARRDRVANLNALKEGGAVRIAFTPNSPSEHLLKAVSSHFDLRLFSGASAWRVETDGSPEAREKLLEGDVDVAVLWEPDVSHALAEPAITKLMGSEDTDRLIVDILLANRRFARDRPEIVDQLLDSYFQTLAHYRAHPAEFSRAVREATGLAQTQVDAMLQGAQWATLGDNALLWHGGGQAGDAGLVDAIDAALKILLENGDFRSNPIPDQDPYRLTNRQFIEALYARRGGEVAKGSGGSLKRPFAPLDASGWQRLREIGTLKAEPVSFRRSSGLLDQEGKAALDRLVERLRRYPNFRILVKGHTGLRGDPRANLVLSAERAEAVAGYLVARYGVDADRLRAIGYGASKPLAKRSGESDRAYAYRLPRVEVVLAAESL